MSLDYALVWKILKEHCGAGDYWRENFLQVAKAHEERGHDLEYRFQGALGFGGKVYIERHRAPRVSCYKEDDTPERLKMIRKANKALAMLRSAP